MKLSINKKLRIGLIFILIVFLVPISYLLYREVEHSGVEEQKVNLFSYSNKGTINYKVFLKPNILYESSILDGGQLYISEFVDHIKTSFLYQYKGERNAQINGTYEIIGRVTGFTGEGEEIINIWSKDFTIVSKENFNITNKTRVIREEIDLRLDEYNNFASEVIKTSKINCQTNLSIIMSIEIKGETDKGTFEDSISPTMVIPLNTNMFTISGNLEVDKLGSLQETIEVQLPVNQKKVVFYGIIIGILLLGLIFLIFFTTGVTITDPLEKKLKQIFKKHGDRLVALNSEIAITSEPKIKVKSIDDLVRIADEIGKPIIYRHSRDLKNISRFYVFDGKQTYSLDLTEALIIEEKRQLEKEINKRKNSKKNEKKESKIES